jgi:hypothetical protein
VKLVGYDHLLLNAAADLFSGLMGLVFVILAVYLAYTSTRNAVPFNLRQLMMPIMNILISSVLLYYCRLLYRKTVAVRNALAAGTYAPPRITATKYDIIAKIHPKRSACQGSTYIVDVNYLLWIINSSNTSHAA